MGSETTTLPGTKRELIVNCALRVFAAAPPEIRDRVRWLPIGVPIDLGG